MMVESMFNMCRLYEKPHRNQGLRPLRIWHETQHCELMNEYDRPTATVSEDARAASGASIPQSTFQPEKDKRSLSDDMLNKIHEPARDWPSLSPEHGKVAALRWVSALHAHGAWGQLSGAWTSLLQQAGSVMDTKSEKVAAW